MLGVARRLEPRLYVPLALRHGAVLRPLCEVVGIGEDEHGDYVVVWIDHVTGRRGRAPAPRLVLAAGTLGTVRLLLDARDRLGTLPRLPARLGANFSTNGDLLWWVPRTEPSPRSDRGPTITAHRTWREDGQHRFMLGEAGLPVNALPLPGPLRRRLASSALLFGIGAERAAAQLQLDGPALRASADRRIDRELYRSMRAACAAVARGYRPDRAGEAEPRNEGRGPLLTVHPVGGAAIGRSASDGVVDHTGQVFGHPGLHVADGSLYPRAPGVPPSMTIAALAERQAELMV